MRHHGLADPRDNDIRAAEDDVIRKAQNAPALRAQPFVAAGIVNLPAGPLVRRPVELDDEPRINAHEIRNIATDRHLQAEFCHDAAVA